ncbi:GMC family oxidoreductase [Ferruginibacter paludis]|uniref:GMC family oxidoreductase n=1 Tax=Ferruginibacter paludis TaxID=1310417 RepID=UPI0025B61370|nr:GMC family oxidoreductase [Ferruginibacter paludis]MDN3657856.1 GMC family oxidoreductase [Ferruginibacter paludis]
MEKFDAIVIGSGAGGSVMAHQLSLKGLRVAVIEKGKRENPILFEHSEVEMFPQLYKNAGLQSSKDNALTIAQGCTVGGSTVINNAIWLRPDLDKILPEWEKAGATVPKNELIKIYGILEKALRVKPIDPQKANRGADIFMRGCQELGIPASYLDNNREECLCCGWCNYGCRYNRKTSMLVTFIPWAEKLGAQFLDECIDTQILTNGKRATGVQFYRQGSLQQIYADKIVVSCGAIGSSALLLQSGIALGGRVGRGFHMLGGVFVTAETMETINGYDGIGLTCYAKASEDYVIESYFAPPVVFSISVGGFFRTHFERMMNYCKYADAGVMIATDPTGVITLDKKGNAVIDIKYTDTDLSRLKEGIKTLSKIFFRGGAVKVLPSSFNIIEFGSENDLNSIDTLVKRPEDLTIGSAHPQGGNAMCEDSRKGVVGLDFRVHGYDNIFVADTSVFPTNIRANCQATAMAMSYYAASFVAAS